MANFVIIAVLAIFVLLGLSETIRHFKGQGACCGGGGGKTVREKKKLDGPKLGEKKILIEGMHCENCQNRVERAVNRIDGAACRVNLRKKLATVSYTKEPDDERLRRAIEEAGYTVKEISG